MTFAERLISLRKSHKLTQKQIYESLKMAPTVYKRYELGQHEPAFKQLWSLADYFSVSIDYLVGRSDNPQRL